MVCKMWTLEEEIKLREVFPSYSKEELETEFNRGYNSIRQKAMKLGIKRESNIKEGNCICKKCRRELPWVPEYFPKLKSEKNLRQVCRECNPKYGSFIENYKEKHYWDEEMDALLIKVYPNYANREIEEMNIFPQFKIKGVIDRANSLGIKKSSETIKRIRQLVSIRLKNNPRPRFVSFETRRKISEAWKEKYRNGYINPNKGAIRGEETRKKISLVRKKEGKWVGVDNPRHRNPLVGESNGRWEGGLTPIYFMLRSNITEWKKKSMEYCNYKCVITGKNFDEIHHLTPFNKIVDSALEKLEMKKKKVKDYSQQDIDKLIALVQEYHNKELGVCLTKEIHKEFHDIYGYKNPTKEDFEEFRNNYNIQINKFNVTGQRAV